MSDTGPTPAGAWIHSARHYAALGRDIEGGQAGTERWLTLGRYLCKTHQNTSSHDIKAGKITI